MNSEPTSVSFSRGAAGECAFTNEAEARAVLSMRERAAAVARRNGYWGTAREIEALALTTHEGTNS